ncbi:sugar transferase [Streptococcus suis]|nr:sugar transferase [Streptococcus suis]
MLIGLYLALHPEHSLSFSPEELDEFVLAIPWLILFYIFINNVFDTNIYYNQTKTNIVINTLIVQVIFSIVLSIVCTLYVETFLMDLKFIVFYFIFSSVVAITIHLGIFNFFIHMIRPRRVLILGKPKAVFKAVDNFDYSSETLHRITHLVIGNYFNNLKKVVEEVDVVYIAGVLEPAISQELYNYLIRKDKIVYLTSTIENSVSINAQLLNISDESIIQVSPYYLTKEQAVVKRLMDILVSFTLLILLSPIMLLTIIAIKLESKGPVFYQQERVTLGNTVFPILKFRSMVTDAEAKTGPILAQKNDSRVTKVGQFIRTTRIDEIPQLINVLRGEMSIIGPRPERPNFVKEFTEINPFYPLRHNVRAGITGYAQVYGKYTSDFESKLKFDLLYIKKYNFLLDVKLLLKTILTVFDKMSSQGQSDESSVATPSKLNNDIQILK